MNANLKLFILLFLFGILLVGLKDRESDQFFGSMVLINNKEILSRVLYFYFHFEIGVEIKNILK